MRVHILSLINLREGRDDFHYFSEFTVSQKLGGMVTIKRVEVRKGHDSLEGRTAFDRMKVTGSKLELPLVGQSESAFEGAAWLPRCDGLW